MKSRVRANLGNSIRRCYKKRPIQFDSILSTDEGVAQLSINSNPHILFSFLSYCVFFDAHKDGNLCHFIHRKMNTKEFFYQITWNDQPWICLTIFHTCELERPFVSTVARELKFIISWAASLVHRRGELRATHPQPTDSWTWKKTWVKSTPVRNAISWEVGSPWV